MPLERSAAAVADMLNAAQTILQYTAGKTREMYEFDQFLRHAVERNIEIIGEAARRLPPVFRDAHPELPWRAIMGTRHILAHEYDAVDNDIIWRIIVEHLPALVERLRGMVPPAPPDPERTDAG